jgi:hypothetical protein
MNLTDLLAKGYLPKELPPCFVSTEFANKYNQIKLEVITNQAAKLNSILHAIQANTTLSASDKAEEKMKAKQVFKNRSDFSDCVQFTIPKTGLARNTIKIPNPAHHGKLADFITSNYHDIRAIFAYSNMSTSKPDIETETGENKRAIKHESYSYFKEQSVIKSYNFQIHLKTDISKFYNSIYTHTVPWVTFGGKEKYKRNRDLHNSDPTKVTSIYGDFIDRALSWCQNQQTMGIPIGPDTSLIVAEIIACHIDKILDQKLKRKKIKWIGFRYYDDYSMFFHSELDAQVALTNLREILGDFELKINDEKTQIGVSSNELERDWALALKSFFFRPFETDQKDDIWNFFSLAFKYAKDYPKDNVLKYALNKFNFVRIEKQNWIFFQALLFRLGLTDPSSLAKISKLLISYKSLVHKTELKHFCFEVINRNYQKTNDYELTWALWLLKEFQIQPTKDIYTKVFKSKSVCASLVALDLINQNISIRTFDYSDVEELFTIENLNKQYWLLVYECIYKNWLDFIPVSIVTEHFFFDTLKNNLVYFYDENKTLEPLMVEKSYFERIERKITQVDKYMQTNDFKDEKIKTEIRSLSKMLLKNVKAESNSHSNLVKKLESSDLLIKKIIKKVELIKLKQQAFETKRIYFVLGKRLEELEILTSKELIFQAKQDKNLLFDPEYD